MPTKLVALRFTPSEILAMEELLLTGTYRSKSALIVRAVHNLFEAERINSLTFLAINGERLSMRRGKCHPSRKAIHEKKAPDPTVSKTERSLFEQKRAASVPRGGRRVKKPARRTPNHRRNPQAKDGRKKTAPQLKVKNKP